MEDKYIVVERVPKIPDDYKYDCETTEFYVCRHEYTGEEIHIAKEPLLYLPTEETEKIFHDGYNQGYSAGFDDGHNQGFDDGFSKGYGKHESEHSQRKVDKSKKSNIKCEHCKYFIDYTIPHLCQNENSKRWQVNYWNRCKHFEWSDEYNE